MSFPPRAARTPLSIRRVIGVSSRGIASAAEWMKAASLNLSYSTVKWRLSGVRPRYSASLATASDTRDSSCSASTGWLNVTVATSFFRFGSRGS